MKYNDSSGKSGIVEFETTPDSITVQFKDGWKYTYTSDKIGQSKVNTMQDLAYGGEGLNSFINKNPDVKGGYTSKRY